MNFKAPEDTEEREQVELDEVKGKETFLQYDFRDKARIQRSDIHGLFFAFLNRSRFRFSIWDILEYAIRCMCIRHIADDRRSKSYKKHFLFEKAEEKFMNELDVVRIVKTLRKFKMFA